MSFLWRKLRLVSGSSGDSSSSSTEDDELVMNSGDSMSSSVMEESVKDEERQGEGPSSGRGPGKSPSPFDPALSPNQVKKIKLDDEAGDSAQSIDFLDDNALYEESTSDEDIGESEMDASSEEDYIGLYSAAASASPLPEEEDDTLNYEVLSSAEIAKSMKEKIQKMSSLLNIPSATCRLLLSHFRWDEGKLTETYYGSDGDCEKLFKQAGAVNPFRAEDMNQVPVTNSQGMELCQVCFDEIESSEMYSMKCGHRCCKFCWREHIRTKVVEEGVGDTISCIAPNCHLYLDDDSVTELITDSLVTSKYEQLITSSYVTSNPLMKWCTGLDCTNAIKVTDTEKHGQTVTCRCGHSFCFTCAENSHVPILTCQMLKKWIKKNKDDSETSNWISVNTKECPKCHASIQKNGGCNHMTCRNRACNEHFCWVCLGPWENHDPYRCNRYNDQEDPTRNQQENTRAALNRYLFYFNRYANHMSSLKLEKQLYEKVADKMQDMQAMEMSWVEVQFLKKAVDVLCRCRQTLMYTYVFAFYGKASNEMAIFEANQQDLQDSVEKLSGFLERDIDQETSQVADLKQQVQDKSHYCESRRQVLLTHLKEGYEKDLWTFRD